MRTLVFLALMATGIQVQAQSVINYDYFEVGYDYLDTDRSDADGFALEASFSVNDSIHMGGFYKNLEGDFVDFDRYGLFGGYNTAMTDKTDFFVQLELGQLDTRIGDEFTYGLGLGTRTAFTEVFELNTKLAYTEVDEINDGFYEIEVQGLFNITEVFAITAEIKSFDGEEGAGVGVRFNF